MLSDCTDRTLKVKKLSSPFEIYQYSFFASKTPTLYLFQGSVRSQVKFDGERTLDGLLKFLDKNGIKVADKKEEKDEL